MSKKAEPYLHLVSYICSDGKADEHAYQAISPRELNSLVMEGMAIAMMVRS